MMRRLLAVAACLAVGGIVAAALYWALLNTPESNALTLSMSAAVVLLIVLASAMAVNAAVLLALGGSVRASLVAAAGGVHRFILAAVPAVLLAWAVRRGDVWVEQHSGEISASVIAALGWSDVRPLFRAETYLSTWLRWVILPAVALGALTQMLQHGERAVLSARWVRATFNWRTLAIATASFIALMVLPWRLAYWRPSGLPPTWVEPAAAGLRLLVAGTAVTLGAAIIVTTVARAVLGRAQE